MVPMLEPQEGTGPRPQGPMVGGWPLPLLRALGRHQRGSGGLHREREFTVGLEVGQVVCWMGRWEGNLSCRPKSQVRGVETWVSGCMAMLERGRGGSCREPGERGQLTTHTDAHVHCGQLSSRPITPIISFSSHGCLGGTTHTQQIQKLRLQKRKVICSGHTAVRMCTLAAWLP